MPFTTVNEYVFANHNIFKMALTGECMQHDDAVLTVSGMWLLTGSTMERGSTVPVAALGRSGVYKK